MSTRRRVEFELVGNAGNIEAVLNRLNSGISRTARQSSGLNRELGMVDRQLQAIKTTARYALAGGLIFGITGAISRLRDFQDRLAQVTALSGTVNAQGSYTAPSTNFLNRVGDQAILMSNQLGIAVGDVQDYMSRFFSAFDVGRMGGNEKLAQLQQFVSEVGNLQASLGAEAGDPQQLAGGIAGFVRQIDPRGRNIGQNTERISGLIWQMLAQTPNVTGRDISRDIGRVGATMTIANMTPEQVFAVWTQAGAAGGSASVIGRGVAQLLGTSLLHPTTPAQVRAFRQAGLPTDPTTLRTMGGMQVLERMMTAVAPKGARVRNPMALNDENLEDPEAIAGAGVHGINLTLLYNLLGRQESVRQFINLIAQGAVPALKEHVRTLNSANAQEQQHQREQAAQRQRVLSQVAQAASNLPLQMVRQARWPLEHLVAPPLVGLSNLSARHPQATQATEAALGIALAGYGAGRLARAFRRARGRGAGVRGAGMEAAGMAITAEELPNILQGGSADGSRANPYWVVISPVSWQVGSPGGTNPFSDPVPGANTKSKMAKRLAEKLSIPGGSAAAGAAGGGFLAGDTALAATGIGLPLAALLAAAYFGQGRGPMVGQVTQTMNQNARSQQFGGDRYFRGALDTTIRLVDAQGRTIAVDRQKGVPVKQIPDKGIPTAQGRPGSRRGSH